MEYYSAITKNEILAFSMTLMELQCIMLSKIEKDKYHMISLLWNLRNKTDEHMGGGKERKTNYETLRTEIGRAHV